MVIGPGEAVGLIVPGSQLVMNGDVLQRYQCSCCFEVQWEKEGTYSVHLGLVVVLVGSVQSGKSESPGTL